MFEYKLLNQDGHARAGTFTTPHGVIETPVFMPVGTHGAVKSASPSELLHIGSQIILANTYHMYLRPGDEVVKKTGGLHAFMQWDGPILTDSGGFQVFSLGERGINGKERIPLRKVAEEGITFQSHIDGSSHFLSPEKSISIQQNLGADIIMAFDHPVYSLGAQEAIADAVERTHRWLVRSKEQWQKGNTGAQALFGIIQGGIHQELHTKSAEFILSQDLPGNAIGGLTIGEGKDVMWAATDSLNKLLPTNKPRYFMGLGGPLDLVEAVGRGMDMFDCVEPSRLARHGTVWQAEGAAEAFWSGNTIELQKGHLHISRLNMLNAQHKEDPRPLVEYPTSLPTDLQAFSRATLHHYVKENEMLGYRILTLHNIAFLHQITFHMRNAIQAGTFSQLAKAFGIEL